MPNMKQFLYGLANSAPITVQMMLQQRDYKQKEDQIELSRKQLKLEEDLNPSKIEYYKSGAEASEASVDVSKQELQMKMDISKNSKEYKSIMLSIGKEYEKAQPNYQNIANLNKKKQAVVGQTMMLQSMPGYQNLGDYWKDTPREIEVLDKFATLSQMMVKPENRKAITQAMQDVQNDKKPLSQLFIEFSKLDISPEAKRAMSNVKGEVDKVTEFTAQEISNYFKANPLKDPIGWEKSVMAGEVFPGMLDVGWQGVFLSEETELRRIGQDSRISEFYNDPGKGATKEQLLTAVKDAGYAAYKQKYFQAGSGASASFRLQGGEIFLQGLSEIGVLPDSFVTFQQPNYMKKYDSYETPRLGTVGREPIQEPVMDNRSRIEKNYENAPFNRFTRGVGAVVKEAARQLPQDEDVFEQF